MDTLLLINLGVAVLVAGISLPLLWGKVKMNAFYGIRFMQAFESDEEWYRINRIGAKILIGWSVALAVLTLIVWWRMQPTKGAMIGMSFLPMVYVLAMAHALFASTRK
ncbi:MAG: SdpI family protein [Verrucomicrobiota bacterium]